MDNYNRNRRIIRDLVRARMNGTARPEPEGGAMPPPPLPAEGEGTNAMLVHCQPGPQGQWHWHMLPPLPSTGEGAMPPPQPSTGEGAMPPPLPSTSAMPPLPSTSAVSSATEKPQPTSPERRNREEEQPHSSIDQRPHSPPPVDHRAYSRGTHTHRHRHSAAPLGDTRGHSRGPLNNHHFHAIDEIVEIYDSDSDTDTDDAEEEVEVEIVDLARPAENIEIGRMDKMKAGLHHGAGYNKLGIQRSFGLLRPVQPEDPQETRKLISQADIWEILACPVCLDIPFGPVRICANGHTVCSSCQLKLETCPVCRGFIGPVARNMPIEQLIGKSKFQCPQGCGKEILGVDMPEHMNELCVFREFDCIFCRDKDNGRPKAKVTMRTYLDHMINVHNAPGSTAPRENCFVHTPIRLRNGVINGLLVEVPHHFVFEENLFLINYVQGDEAINIWISVVANKHEALKYCCQLHFKTKNNGTQQFNLPVQPFNGRFQVPYGSNASFNWQQLYEVSSNIPPNFTPGPFPDIVTSTFDVTFIAKVCYSPEFLKRLPPQAASLASTSSISISSLASSSSVSSLSLSGDEC